MNGSNILLDSNIVLYLLNGDKVLADLLYKKNLYISFIAQLELLGYKGVSNKERAKIENFINECIVIDINDAIKKEVIEIRKTSKLKLPDSIILATARFLGVSLLTADSDFSQVGTEEIIIYE